MEKIVTFEEALKATGYGKFNIAMVFICGTILYTVNADAYSIGYLLPSAQCDLNLTTFDKGMLTSASFFGMICSSHFWGLIADTKGRKKVIIITLISSFICTLINSFLTNIWLFTLMRFLSGIFMVGASTSTYAYLGEFHINKYRAVSITCASIFIAIAIIALPGIAWLVIPQTWIINIFDIIVYKPWRLFLVLNSFPGLIIAAILYMVPESPKFLLMQGKQYKALDVLKLVYVCNTGKKTTNFPVTQILEHDAIIGETEKQNILDTIIVQTTPLFRKPHLLNTFVSCFMQFGLFAVSSGLLFWYPEIVNQLAENERNHFGNPITVCEAISAVQHVNVTESTSCSDGVDPSVFEQNLIIGGAYAIGFIVISLVVNKLGKRCLLVMFLTLSSASGIALCWITYRMMIDYLFVGLLVLSGISVGIVNAAVVDIFPTNLRGMAMSISLMFGRLGSVISSPIIGILLEYNCNATFIILSGLLLACAAVSLFIPSESITEGKKYPDD